MTIRTAHFFDFKVEYPSGVMGIRPMDVRGALIERFRGMPDDVVQRMYGSILRMEFQTVSENGIQRQVWRIVKVSKPTAAAAA